MIPTARMKNIPITSRLFFGAVLFCVYAVTIVPITKSSVSSAVAQEAANLVANPIVQTSGQAPVASESGKTLGKTKANAGGKKNSLVDEIEDWPRRADARWRARR